MNDFIVYSLILVAVSINYFFGMYSIIEGIFSFFVPLFVVLLNYWYISIPIIVLIIVGYIRTKREGLKRFLRILLAFLFLSCLFTLIYYLFDVV